ncbi:MAG: hypothetical protein R3E90_14600 [Marinicella sp.]
MKKLLLCALILSISQHTGANVGWIWSFGTESGTIITDGNYYDTLNEASFFIHQFSVSQSSEASIPLTEFTNDQPSPGLTWIPDQVTVFFGVEIGYVTFENNLGYQYVFSVQPDDSQLIDGLAPQLNNILVSAPLTIYPDFIFVNNFANQTTTN